MNYTPLKYYCTVNSVTRVINVLKYDKQGINYEREKDGLVYTGNLDNSFRLNGDDYAWFKNLKDNNICTRVDLTIKQPCSGSEKVVYVGYFSPRDGKWDEDECYVDITPKINDIFSCVKKAMANEVNILAVPTVYSAKTYINSSHEFYYEILVKPNPITEPCSGQSPPAPSAPQSGYAIIRTTTQFQYGFIWVRFTAYARELLSTKPDDGQGTWTYDDSIEMWTKPAGQNTGNCTGWQNFESFFIVTNKTAVPPTYPPATGLQVVENGGSIFAYEDYSDCATTPPDVGESGHYLTAFGVVKSPPIGCLYTITYDRMRKVSDCLNYAIGQTGCGLTLKSDLLNATTNPVTGENPNPLNAFLMSHGSDITRHYVSNPATIGRITLQSFLDDLKIWFNADWTIVGSEIVLEHISYFSKSQQIDFTAIDAGKWLVGKNEYEWDVSELFSEEKFTMPEAELVDFKGKSIIYEASCTNGNFKDYNMDRLTSDLYNFIYYPNAVDTSLFVCVIRNSAGDIASEVGNISGVSRINAYLSFANLHVRYWKYGRILPTGLMNSVQTVFNNPKKLKIQSSFTVPLCCSDFDPIKLQKSQLGWGEVRTAKFDFKTKTLTIQLAHND